VSTDPGDSGDGELIGEQIDFYRADAEPFDRWLTRLLTEGNDAPAARAYRAGRALIGGVFERGAPLGHVLEIAAGTGRLVDLYARHAESVVLLDASPESLAIAARRLDAAAPVDLVAADVFAWEGGRTFDTIVFAAWLHHVPRARLDTFWHTVRSLLAAGGRVIFDFPDASLPTTARAEMPAEPSTAYGFYAPVDGVGTRDHFGRRWRVVHHVWDRDDLARRLHDLGWTMNVLGPGLADNMLWADAHR
jgi:SAM-dependent methyltransferase